MAVNQDMYDTLQQYFTDASPELDTLFQNALSMYFTNNPIDIDFSSNASFDTAGQSVLSAYFQNNSVNVDIDFSSNASFDTAGQSVLSSYFQNNPISVDLTTTNNKVDAVKVVVDAVKTKVDTNLDAKVSSISSGGSVDLTATNNKIDAVKVVVDDVQSKVISVKSIVDTNLDAKVSSISSGGSVDLTTTNDKIDAVKFVVDDVKVKVDTNLDAKVSSLGNIDVSTLDLSPVASSVVAVISQNVQDFISNTSLDGSSGSLYFDGAQVLVDGDNRIYTVLGCQILTTIGGQADYFYVLQDSQGRKMLTVQDNLTLKEYINTTGEGA